MQIFKTHKHVDIDKSIGNVKITTTHYMRPIENSDKWERYTTINCWYDRDCEDCPMGWEDRRYEDCGCLFNYEFNVPIWKCMLPRWLKNNFKSKIQERKKGIVLI